MKKIEECLDLVLKSLVNNNDSLCILEEEGIQEPNNRKLTLSPEYKKLLIELPLNNDEVKQLLEILKEEKYLNYEIVSGVSGASIYVKNKTNNAIGNTVNINNAYNEWIGKPDRIVITLKGKFFIRGGGYTGKKKKKDRTALLQNLAIWITAIGTGLGGIYIIGKAFIWLCKHFNF